MLSVEWCGFDCNCLKSQDMPPRLHMGEEIQEWIELETEQKSMQTEKNPFRKRINL